MTKPSWTSSQKRRYAAGLGLLACVAGVGCTELQSSPGENDLDAAMNGDAGDDASVGDSMVPPLNGRDAEDEPGGGDGGPDGSDPDASPGDASPIVTIAFPLPGRTEADAITVRGEASDPDGDLASVTLNGEVVSLDRDGGFNARISLAQGDNDIEAQATDERANTSGVASVRVERAAIRIWSHPLDLAIDDSNDETLLLDETFDAVFAVDLDSGDVRVIADPATDSGPAMSSPSEVEIDPNTRRAFVLCAEGIAVIDLMTLARTVTPLTLGDLYIVDLVYDQFFDELFAVGGSTIFTIDVGTGRPTVLSNDTNAAQGPALQAGTVLAADINGERIFVAHQSAGTLFSVATDDGNRTQLPTGAGPTHNSPVSLLYDRNAQTLLVGDEDGHGIVEVTLAGARTILSDGDIGSGPVLGHSPQAMAFAPMERILVADWRRPQFIVPSRGQLTLVDRTNGHRTYMPFGVGSGQGLAEPMALELDEANERVLLVDGSAGALVSVHLRTGNRLVVSDAITGSGPRLIYPAGLALDVDNGRAFVADSSSKAILSVDLETGNRSFVSNNDGVGAGAVFELPRAVIYDADEQRLLVGEPGTASGGGKVVSVDLATGNRVVRSDDSRTGPVLQGVSAISRGPTDDTLIAVVNNDLISVDLVSGDRAFVYDDPASAMSFVQGFATDGERWFVANNVLGEEGLTAAGVLAGTFAGAATEQLSSILEPSQGPAPSRLLWGGPMTLIGRDVALISLTDVGAVLAIDLVSGDRIVFSM